MERRQSTAASNQQEQLQTDNDKKEGQREYEYTVAKFVRLQFKDELEELHQCDQSKQNFDNKSKSLYNQLLNEIKISNTQKQKQLDISVAEYAHVQNGHYDQYDKSNPLQDINANNNFRVYVNQSHKTEEELKEWLGVQKKELLKTEMSLFESSQFTGTLILMQRRLINQQEEIRKKVVEFDSLLELIDKKYADIKQKTQKLQTEKTIIKFTFNNVIHMIDKLGKIQLQLQKKKKIYGKTQEKDMYSELISYSKCKEQYEQDYELLQEQIIQLQKLSSISAQKINQQKEGEYLINYLEDFDTIFDVFVLNNDVQKLKQYSGENESINKKQSQEEDFKDGGLDTMQNTGGTTKDTFNTKFTGSSNIYIKSNNYKLTVSIPKKSFTDQKASPLKRKLSTQDQQYLKRNSNKNMTLNSSARLGKALQSPISQHHQQQQSFQKQNSNQSQSQLDKTGKKFMGENSNDNSRISEEEDIDSKMNRIMVEKQNKKQNVMEQLNEFYAKHDNDINKLFDQFNDIFRYYSNQIDIQRDQLFQLELEKQKSINRLDQLDNELQEYIDIVHIQKQKLDKQFDSNDPSLTTNNLKFDILHKENRNQITFNQNTEYSDDASLKSLINYKSKDDIIFSSYLSKQQQKKFQDFSSRKFNQIKERIGIWEEDKYAPSQCADLQTNVHQRKLTRPNLLNAIKMEVENINRGEGPKHMMEEVLYIEKQRKVIRTTLDQQSRSAEHIQRQKPIENIENNETDEEDYGKYNKNSRQGSIKNNTDQEIKIIPTQIKKKGKDNSNNKSKSPPRYFQLSQTRNQEWDHWNKITHFDKMFRQVKKQAIKDTQNPNNNKNYEINQIQLFEKTRKKKHFITLMKNKKREKEQIYNDQQQKLLDQLYEAMGEDDGEKEKLENIFIHKKSVNIKKPDQRPNKSQLQNKSPSRQGRGSDKKLNLDQSPIMPQRKSNFNSKQTIQIKQFDDQSDSKSPKERKPQQVTSAIIDGKRLSALANDRRMSALNSPSPKLTLQIALSHEQMESIESIATSNRLNASNSKITLPIIKNPQDKNSSQNVKVSQTDNHFYKAKSQSPKKKQLKKKQQSPRKNTAKQKSSNNNQQQQKQNSQKQQVPTQQQQQQQLQIKLTQSEKLY